MTTAFQLQSEEFDSVINSEPYITNLEIANIPKNLERGDYKLKLIITGFNKKEDRYDIKEIIDDVSY